MERNDASVTSVLIVAIVAAVTAGIAPIPPGTGPVGVANAATPISSCTTITAPGTYELQADVINSGQDPCIRINASDVVLDGQGHTVDGVRSTGSAGILVRRSTGFTNVTVENLRLTDWDRAILYDDVTDGAVRGNDVVDNIQVSTLGAVFVDDSTDVRVADNNASNNEGIGMVVSASNTTVTGNTALNNTHGGILVAGSNDTVTNNVARHNTRAGLELELLFDSNVRNNVMTGNGDVGAFPRFGYNGGLVVLYSANNTIADNNASDNEVGIRLRSSSRVGSVRDNVLADNTAKNNRVWDFISTNGTDENRVVDLFIGDSDTPTTITFEESRDVALRSVANPPADPPDRRNIGHYVNATNTGDDSYLFLNVSYQQSDVTAAGVDESTIRMFRYAGTWSKVQGTNGVNTGADYAFANVTSFPVPPEVFAPLGNESTVDRTPTATATETETPAEPPQFVYPAKFVCGAIEPERAGDTAAEEPPVKPGNYATAINLHNPHDRELRLRIRVAYATIDREPGPTSEPFTMTLEPHQARELDCREIARRVEQAADADFLKGFVEIRTQTRLQVTTVYTAKATETTRTPAGPGVHVNLSTGINESVQDVVPGSDPVIPDGAPDDDWIVTSDPDRPTPFPAVVLECDTDNVAFAYPNCHDGRAPAGSKLLSTDPAARENVTAGENFTYVRTFDLPAGATAPQLAIDVVADDVATVYLNGNPIGHTAGQSCPCRITASSGDGFQSGQNTLAIEVEDRAGVATSLAVSGNVTANTAGDVDTGTGMSIDVETVQARELQSETTRTTDIDGGTLSAGLVVLTLLLGVPVVVTARRRS